MIAALSGISCKNTILKIAENYLFSPHNFRQFSTEQNIGYGRGRMILVCDKVFDSALDVSIFCAWRSTIKYYFLICPTHPHVSDVYYCDTLTQTKPLCELAIQ